MRTQHNFAFCMFGLILWIQYTKTFFFGRTDPTPNLHSRTILVLRHSKDSRSPSTFKRLYNLSMPFLRTECYAWKSLLSSKKFHFQRTVYPVMKSDVAATVWRQWLVRVSFVFWMLSDIYASCINSVSSGWLEHLLSGYNIILACLIWRILIWLFCES